MANKSRNKFNYTKVKLMRGLFVFFLWIFSFDSIAQSPFILERSIPENEGVSSETILKLINNFEERVDAVHSLMILKNGKVIAEGWWDPYNENSPHELWSLSKSFTSTAIGFAVQEELLSIYDLVISFFPEKIPEEASWQLNQLRIVDLLTMSTGHVKEPKIYNNQSDWVSKFLNSEIEFMPGTHFMYNTPATYMLSAILQKVTGKNLVDYLNSRLFKPLGIQKPEWEFDPSGINTGGWGLHLKTEDIAKFGQLYLNNGKLNGHEILDENWVNKATSKQVSNGSNPENDWTQGYGYQFWRSRYNSYRGDGAMGQFCLVIPEKNMVIAITSGTNNMGLVMQIIWDILIPNVRDSALVKNTKAHDLLIKKLKSLTLLEQNKKTDYDLVNKLTKEKYLINKNDQFVKSISFDFNDDNNLIIFETENENEKISFDFKKFKKTQISSHLPFTNISRSQILPKSSLRYKKNQKIASTGKWLNDNELEVEVYLYETPIKMTYNFDFSENSLILKSTAKNYLGVSNEAQYLKSINYD